jgi:hypothetical protein
MKPQFLLPLVLFVFVLSSLALGQTPEETKGFASRIPAAKQAILKEKIKYKAIKTEAKGGCRMADTDSPLGGLVDLDSPSAPSGQAPTAVHITHHFVRITVLDGAAVTEIDQVFYNPSRWVLEGTYVFPLPPGAVMDRFSIFMAKKEVPAEVLKRKKARDTYDDIVRRLRDPGLVELEGKKQLRVKAHVFPIPGRGTMRVRMRYIHTLKTHGEVLRCRYPLRSIRSSEETPLREYGVYVEARSGVPLHRAFCPSHEMKIMRHHAGGVHAWFRRRGGIPDRDFEFCLKPSKKAFGFNVHCHATPSGDGFFMAVVQPGRTSIRNPELLFSGVTPSERFPDNLPTILRPGRTYFAFGRFQGEMGCATAVFRGRTGGEDLVRTLPLSFSAVETGNDFITGLWARCKVEELEKRLGRGENEKETKEEILALAKRYGILTRLTSLLAK